MNKRNKIVFVAITLLIGTCSISINAEERTSQHCTVSTQCGADNVTWTNVGDVKIISTGSKVVNNTLKNQYVQEQISSKGETRKIIVDQINESFDADGNISKKVDFDFNDSGIYISEKVDYYIYNPATDQAVISKTQLFEGNVLISENEVPTTWKSEGIKKFTKGINKQKSGTYVEDYKELETSNFGGQKWKRKDYKIYKYNSKGHLIKKEDRDYTANGDIYSRVIYDYKYNQITKKNTIVRTRHYRSSELLSDVKVATTWKTEGKKKKYTKGKQNTVNGVYIEEIKKKQISNFGETRTILTDFTVKKYNKFKQLACEINYDYDKNGKVIAQKELTYYYNPTTKKVSDTRIRTYKQERLTSDLKKSQVKKPAKRGMITNEFEGVDLTYTYGHKGIDIAAPIGTPIYPVMKGQIIEIAYDSIGGNKVVVHHNINGIDYITYYGHMSELTKNYKVGDFVSTKSKIGSMGSTGLSTGSHVHFELMIDTKVKNRTNAVNPREYIDFPKLWESY